jgi:phosphoserine phosphatase RsbU/P
MAKGTRTSGAGVAREVPDSRDSAREALDPRDPRNPARELPERRDSERLAALVQEVAELRRAAEAKDLLLSASALVAHTLQRSLLPDALPEVPGVQFASAYHPVGEGAEVGGDFYDVFQVPSGCWLVVGDVCGKGIEAAAVTALVRHSIRALALHQDSPAQVLCSVNDAMLSHELAWRFATAILVRLDLASAGPVGATIASAGHPPPVLLGADGRTCCPEVSGTMLGVLREASSRDVLVTLEPGASVVLYTDGLTDAGVPRRVVAPEELCGHLARGGPAEPGALVRRLEDLAGARSGGRLCDDIAIVAARVDP